MRRACSLLFMICFLHGCSTSDRVVAPEFDPAAAAAGAIAEYDKDADGALSKSECKNTPFDPAKWDADQDGKVVESEIQERLEKYMAKKTGLTDLTIQVTLNRQPLENATVVFEPEAYLGGVIEEAEAVTDFDGVGMPRIPEVVAKDPVLIGVRPGLYKIRVTHPDVKLAAKYNDETTLAFDVSPLDVLGTVQLHLRR